MVGYLSLLSTSQLKGVPYIPEHAPSPPPPAHRPRQDEWPRENSPWEALGGFEKCQKMTPEHWCKNDGASQTASKWHLVYYPLVWSSLTWIQFALFAICSSSTPRAPFHVHVILHVRLKDLLVVLCHILRADNPGKMKVQNMSQQRVNTDFGGRWSGRWQPNKPFSQQNFTPFFTQSPFLSRSSFLSELEFNQNLLPIGLQTSNTELGFQPQFPKKKNEQWPESIHLLTHLNGHFHYFTLFLLVCLFWVGKITSCFPTPPPQKARQCSHWQPLDNPNAREAEKTFNMKYENECMVKCNHEKTNQKEWSYERFLLEFMRGKTWKYSNLVKLRIQILMKSCNPFSKVAQMHVMESYISLPFYPVVDSNLTTITTDRRGGGAFFWTCAVTGAIGKRGREGSVLFWRRGGG